MSSAGDELSRRKRRDKGRIQPLPRGQSRMMARMRPALVVALAIVTASVASGNKGAMYRVQVADLRVQPLDKKGGPTGEAQPASFTQIEIIECRLEHAPGARPIQVWFKGTSDSGGRLRRLGDGPYSEMMPEVGGTADDAASCAFSAFINSSFRLPPQRDFKILVRATFSKMR
jgi:hypothetical protein